MNIKRFLMYIEAALIAMIFAALAFRTFLEFTAGAPSALSNQVIQTSLIIAIYVRLVRMTP